MSVCELCGRDSRLYKAKVEGTELNVCEACGKFGTVYRPVETPKQVSRPVKAKPEVIEVIVSDYSEIIRKAREKLGLNQEDFAKKLNEKESFIQKVESGHIEPAIEIARKFEKLLNVILVEEASTNVLSAKKQHSGPLTIGDIVKLKQ
ncbi:TIGR00270 family protein [Candidatus Woesearchaeota archaeon]|nr:TIGR00270 family protein [Candidatus Woesearchaeota archaeon]